MPLENLYPCAINALIKPALGIEQAVPGFDATLALLRAPRTLTIGLYERAVAMEGAGGVPDAETAVAVERAARCALALEQRFGGGFVKTAWLVMSPNGHFKDALAARHAGGSRSVAQHSKEFNPYQPR